MKVAVVGKGSWGTAFATVLRERGHEVVLAGRDAPENEGVAAAELVCVAVPSRVFREVAEALPGTAPILILTKGLDPGTGNRLSQVVTGRDALVLSGPNHAEEIVQGLPAAAVLASSNEALATEIQHAIHSVRFRIYVNADLVGVELCAASKNVIALAAGAVDGLEAGDNAKAALITRGLAGRRSRAWPEWATSWSRVGAATAAIAELGSSSRAERRPMRRLQRSARSWRD
jgi:glycerol-3-phosphate dehydrogenase (NAD(P)+)